MFDNKLPNFVDKTSTCLNILFNIELYFFKESINWLPIAFVLLNPWAFFENPYCLIISLREPEI